MNLNYNGLWVYLMNVLLKGIPVESSQLANPLQGKSNGYNRKVPFDRQWSLWEKLCTVAKHDLWLKRVASILAGSLVAGTILTGKRVNLRASLDIITVVGSIFGSIKMAPTREPIIIRLLVGGFSGGSMALIGSIQGSLAAINGGAICGGLTLACASGIGRGSSLVPIAATYGAFKGIHLINRYMAKTCQKMKEKRLMKGKLDSIDNCQHYVVNTLMDCWEVGSSSIGVAIAILGIADQLN